MTAQAQVADVLLPADAASRLLDVVRRLTEETHPGLEQRVSLEAHLERELGLDSLARVELLLRIHQAFGVSLSEQALTEAQTPRDLLELVARALAGPSDDAGIVLPTLPEAEAGVPAEAETLIGVLDWHVSRHPERLHVLLYADGEQFEEISYAWLRGAALEIATGLVSRGVQPRQTVALMLPTSSDYLASFYAVMLAGAIPVPIYPPVRVSQLEEHLQRHSRILDNAKSVLMITVPQAKTFALALRSGVPSLKDIVTADELRQPAMPIFYRAGPEDIALLQYTSGSTGDPKGVVLTHANLLANIRIMGNVLRVGTHDVFVSWLPLYHDMGLIGAWLGSLYHALPLVLMSPLAFLARPSRWLEAIHRHRGTISAAPNFAYELCARKLRDEDLQGIDLSCWRLAVNGAEPVSAATLDAFARRFGAQGLRREALTPVYGLAECSVGLTFPPLGRGPRVDTIARGPFAEQRRAVPADPYAADTIRVAACGRVLPGHAIRVVDDGGKELPERRIGRVQFSGPSATRGYYRNTEATQSLFQDGWLDTGDYGYLADAEIYLTGRAKDLIIRGGRNIYPYELEEAVGELTGVRRGCVAVFGSPDPLNGTERLILMAEVRETDESALQALRSRINEVAGNVIGMPPDDVVLTPPHTVLKTSSGKIRRAASRELYERGEIGVRPAPPAWRQLARLVLPSLRVRATDWMRRGSEELYGIYAWAVFLALAIPVWLAIAALQRPRLGHYIVHYGARLLLRCIWLSPAVKGINHLPAKAHLLVINHASYLDAVILTAALPPKYGYIFVAKREFLDSWLPRLFFRGLGALFVERFDAKQGVEDVEAIIGALRGGHNVAVFPEGTFSRETGLRPFRMGAFVAAARAGVPIVSAALTGVRGVLRDRSWLPRRGQVRFEIGALLAPSGDDWANAVSLRDAARTEILRLCDEPDLAPRSQH